MNEPDSELRAQWRAHSAQTPPAALDDAIRAAAHRAVHAKPVSLKARAPWPTWATFAAAASIGAIAIGVWQMQPREIDETRMVTSDVPSRAAPSRPPAVAQPPVAPTVKDQATPAPIVKSRSAAADARDSAAQVASPAAVKTQANAANAATAPVPPTAEQDRTQPQAGVTPTPARAPSPFPAGDAPQQRDAMAPAAPRPDNEPAVGKLAAPAAAREAASITPKAAVPDVPLAPAPAPSPAADASTTTTPPALMKQREAQRSSGAAAPRAQARSANEFIDEIRHALAEHRDSDATRLLADMRARFVDADARLPADLRPWAAHVAPPAP